MNPTTPDKPTKSGTAYITDVAHAALKLLNMAGRTTHRVVTMQKDGPLMDILRRDGIPWGKELLEVAQIEVESFGTPPPQGALQVSNHRSYMDILILMWKSPAVFIARSDMADWPVMGRACRIAGVVFVNRSDTDSRQLARQKISEMLEKGMRVTLFPEGTTKVKPGTLHFKCGGFEAALQAGAPVYPVAIEYLGEMDGWDHGEGGWAHFTRVHAGPTRAKVSFGPQIEAETGEELARQCQEWVEQELERLAALF